MIHSRLSQLMVIAAACLAASFVAAQEELPLLIEPRSCFFAGRSATLSPRGVAENDRITWSLLSGSRVLDRGSSRAVSQPTHDTLDQTVVELPLPTVREGVVLPVECQITLPGGIGIRHSIWLYPEAAFPTHDPWWNTQPIRLYDPGRTAGPERKTTSWLESQGVPFEPLHSLAQLEESKPGVVLIGQGISLREHPKLIESLTRVARGGGRVVCLAPSEGDWPLDWDDSTPDLSLRVSGTLTEYDKRFDRLPVACLLGLVSQRGHVRIRCGEGPWAWAMQRFRQAGDAPDGQLIVCGLDLAKAWDDSPVPRHLLANLLKLLATDASH